MNSDEDEYRRQAADAERQARSLPPGRARLSTSPLPTGFGSATSTMGMVLVARLASLAPSPVSATIKSTLLSASSAQARETAPVARRENGGPVRYSCLRSNQARETLWSGRPDISLPLGVGGVPQHSDARVRFALLRARGKRPYGSAAAEKHDEFAASHSIVSPISAELPTALRARPSQRSSRVKSEFAGLGGG
jgi:hypothetical protein